MAHDNAYYIQTFLKFKKDFCFAFIVELEEKTIFKSQNIAIFGGEQQAFKMEVKSFTQNFKDIVPEYKQSQNLDKVVLISDAFVDKDITEKCDFAITETINFKFLKTSTEKDGNYYRNPTKSRRFNLYKKGSVFYGDIEEIKKLLKNETFYKLGYNHYKTISKNL